MDSKDDGPTQTLPVPRTVASEIQALTPALEALLKERFSSEARSAQNYTMLLSGLALAIAVGLIGDGKLKGGGFEFNASASALAVILFIAAWFFLIRFLFLYWRDRPAIRLNMMTAAMVLNDAAKDWVGTSVVLEGRAEESERIANALASSANMWNFDDLARKEWSNAHDELQTELDQQATRALYISGLASTFYRRASRVDSYTKYFEIGLPCLLVLAATGMIVYMTADGHLSFGHKGSRPGNAQIEHTISASCPNADICAVMNTLETMAATMLHVVALQDHRAGYLRRAPSDR
ncbi:hypothetical protein [Bradyrhizobium japonicum]|nr:hypothetical protein [Bradyrhizobium japonicum]